MKICKLEISQKKFNPEFSIFGVSEKASPEYQH